MAAAPRGGGNDRRPSSRTRGASSGERTRQGGPARRGPRDGESRRDARAQGDSTGRGGRDTSDGGNRRGDQRTGSKPGARGAGGNSASGNSASGNSSGGDSGRGSGKDASERRYGRGPVRGTGAGRGGSRVGGPKKPRPTPRRRPAPEYVPVEDQPHDEEGVRLQKILAGAGLGSRRACERLIEEGRVQVDGVVVTELGTRIIPEEHTLHVDGDRIQLDQNTVYLALNKPAGVVSTMSDDMGRLSLDDVLGPRKERLFHVGRLDADTDGLLLLTNDGELANRLQHPRYEVPKTYVAQVHGIVPKGIGKTLRDGVELDDGPVTVDSFRLLGSRPGHTLIEVVLHEGRKHIVRRLMDEVGYPVETLTRVQIGPVRLGELKAGKTRVLTREEVADLYGAAEL